jgi:hypothetical protein
VNALDVKIEKTLKKFEGKDVIISLDSSGTKVTNRGEWLRQKWKVRKGWIKVHISVADQGKQVVAIKVTDEQVHDSEIFDELVEQSTKNVEALGGKVVQVNGDGAYDSNDNFKKLESKRIKPGIKIRQNSAATARSKNPRKKYVREYLELGYDGWRDKYNYGIRWYTESTFSAVKRKTGEYVRAIKTPNMYREVMLKFIFYNALIKYGETNENPWLNLSG